MGHTTIYGTPVSKESIQQCYREMAGLGQYNDTERTSTNILVMPARNPILLTNKARG